ncbi:MAG: NAD-binding protein, partial [Acidimicrobiales bacterium]
VNSPDHAGWFTPGQGVKDLGLALDLARSHDVDLPAGTFFADRYEQAAAGGWGDADITAVVELLRRR